MSARIGFLDEEAGVRSMSRLTVLLMVLAVLVLVLGVVAYLLLAKHLTGEKTDGGVIAAVGVIVAGLAGGVWGALKERNNLGPSGGANAAR